MKLFQDIHNAFSDYFLHLMHGSLNYSSQSNEIYFNNHDDELIESVKKN